jgi:hypothetical protein
MPATVTFVVSIGRMSMGDMVARPVIEQTVGQLGGRVRPGGAGSATDPIIAEFADKAAAVEAAKQLWFHDSIEAATVHDSDNLATSTIKEGVEKGEVDVVEAAMGGLAVGDAVDALLAAHKAGKLVKPVTEEAEPVEEGTDGDPSEHPALLEMAAEMEAVATKFAALKNDTASVFVEDLKASADALRKIVPAKA